MNGKLIIVIGAFGSGKSEYAINLAYKMNEKHDNVVLVDMDVVNPYFRSRDVKESFTKIGIDVVSPEGEYAFADLPMISPRIRGAIVNKEKNVILDVGGDPAGCRTLGRFVKEIKNRGYEMHHVVNTNRPFTSDVKGITDMKFMLENTSQLKITEFVSNANLMEYTDLEVVKAGVDILSETSQKTGVPFNNFLVLDKLNKNIPDEISGKNKIILDYYLRKPWETNKKQ